LTATRRRKGKGGKKEPSSGKGVGGEKEGRKVVWFEKRKSYICGRRNLLDEEKERPERIGEGEK